MKKEKEIKKFEIKIKKFEIKIIVLYKKNFFIS